MLARASQQQLTKTHVINNSPYFDIRFRFRNAECEIETPCFAEHRRFLAKF